MGLTLIRKSRGTRPRPNAKHAPVPAGGAVSGPKVTLGGPTLAARPDRAAAALPELAVVTTLAPRSRALTTATALARSLNEAVGLRPSSLM